MKKIYILYILTLLFSKNSDAQSITELGFYSPLISTFDAKYKNNHLLVTQQGFKVFDVSNPANPMQVGTATYPGSYAYQIAINGDYAYLGEGGSGYFSVYDITNITVPTLTGSVIIPSTDFLTGGDLIAEGVVAYMCGADSLYVIDVSDPATPALATSIQVISTPFGVASALAIDSTSLFVLTSNEILVFDISNPLSPTLMNSIPNSHSYQSGLTVDTVNHRLFSPWASTLQTHMGFNAYDVSDPSAPVLLFTDSTTFSNGEFGYCDYYNNALLISRGGSIALFDVNTVGHSFLLNFTGQNVPNSTVAVEFKDSVFYNIRRGGYEILQLNGGFPTQVRLISADDISVYPNPANSFINISGLIDQNSSLSIIDALGKTVQKEKLFSTNETITLNKEIKNGIYILKIEGENYSSYSRILISN